MDIGVDGPILTKKNIKISMGQRYTYRTRWVKTIVAIIYFMKLKPLSYNSVTTKTMNLSNVKYIYKHISTNINIGRTSENHGTTISIVHNKGEKYCGSSLYY